MHVASNPGECWGIFFFHLFFSKLFGKVRNYANCHFVFPWCVGRGGEGKGRKNAHIYAHTWSGRNGETNFSACFLFFGKLRSAFQKNSYSFALSFSLFCLKHKTDLGHSISKGEKRQVSFYWMGDLRRYLFFLPLRRCPNNIRHTTPVRKKIEERKEKRLVQDSPIFLKV